MKKIAVFGAFDTKGEEFSYLIDCIHEGNPQAEVISIDVSARVHQGLFPATVSNEVIARYGGGDLATLSSGDRLTGVTVMIEGAKSYMAELYASGQIGGVITLGGGSGTVLGMQVLRQLPVGFPKIMVSTIAASATTGRFWEGCDIMVINSVVDISGLNRISRPIFRAAAGAITGAVQLGQPTSTNQKPVVAATMFGMTTPGVEAAKALLETMGYEVLVFHANGAGGRTMEQLIEKGFIDGVLDLTTTEWADTVCGGVCAGGEKRLEAAARCGIPQVVSVGALDMVNLNDRPERFRGRNFHGSEKSSLMRTTPEENKQFGKIIGEKLSACTAPSALYLPLNGVSEIDKQDGPFWDPQADQALFDAIKANLHSSLVQVEEFPLHINDREFGEAAARKLDELIQNAKGRGAARCI